MTEENVKVDVKLVREIKGKIIELSEGREVFIGQVAGKNDFFLHCKNSNGDVTQLVFTPDATSALYALLSDHVPKFSTEHVSAGKEKTFNTGERLVWTCVIPKGKDNA